MIIHIVRFSSRLPGQRIPELFDAQVREYARVPGIHPRGDLSLADRVRRRQRQDRDGRAMASIGYQLSGAARPADVGRPTRA